jgi:hypothetical protein
LVLTALILICSTAITPDLSACDRAHAVDVMQLPIESANPVTCLMHGQAYLAETSLGQDLRDNERVKVVCVRSQTATAVGEIAKQPAGAWDRSRRFRLNPIRSTLAPSTATCAPDPAAMLALA